MNFAAYGSKMDDASLVVSIADKGEQSYVVARFRQLTQDIVGPDFGPGIERMR
jgi:hypothetical protein